MLFSGFMMILLDQMTSYCVDFTEIGFIEFKFIETDFNASFEAWKHSAKRPELGKSPEAPSSSAS